jgi:Holliday junction resolvasome RuvABC DNA-binding subunit
MGAKIMSLSDVGALNQKQWTVEKLAVATVKVLTAYTGIGKITADKAIAEAAGILNEQGAEDAGRLAIEHYHQKAPPAKILTDWEDGGLPIKAVALSSAQALSALKGIDEQLALRLISKAQDIVNERGLYESRIIAPAGTVRQTSSAFDERWLSGEVDPPPMSLRVRQNFERAQKEYKAANG